MTATKETIKATADALGITMRAKFVPFSKSRNKGEKHPGLSWRVTLAKGGRDFHTFDYGSGVAYAPGYKHQPGDTPSMWERNRRVDWECEHGVAAVFHEWGCSSKKPNEPILPDLADVLSCIVMEADALDHPDYESFAGEFGYDADSRKGEAIYRACLETGLRLRAALGDDGLRQLREAVQDY